MTCKYLYIDDEAEQVEAFANALREDDKLEIEYQHVSDFKPEVIKESINQYDGILIDLRLDQTAKEEGGEISLFTATEYAQHLRTLATKGEIHDIPIILFSTDQKLREVYKGDLSSHNLFDRFLMKDAIFLADNKHSIVAKFVALAEGYKFLKDKNIIEIIGLEAADYGQVDERVFSRFETDERESPIHEYAQVVLKDVIYPQGILIKENILAALLGLNLSEAGSEDWDKILEVFSSAKYTGVFSQAWDRWWKFKVDQIFNQEFGTKLSFLDAGKSVELINEKLGTTLVKAEPMEKNYSSNYTTLCKKLGQPLDALEGYRVYSPHEPKPWQEYEYYSLKAILENSDLKVHISDKQKLEEARANLS